MRLAGLLVDALGPVDLHVGLGEHHRAIGTLHRVDEAVARRMRDQLARLAADLSVDQDVGADLVVIEHVARRELEIPVHVAGVGIPRDHAVGIEVVARPIERIEHRHRIAGAPQGLVGRGIVSAGDPNRTAAGAPGIGVAFPGFAAGLAGRRDRELLPHALAGRGIEPGDPVAHALVAVRRADDDFVLDGERGCREGHVRGILERGFPHHFAGFLVGRDDPRRVAEAARAGDDEIAPQGWATAAHQAILFGVHAPDDAADIAGTRIDLVEDVPGIGHVEETVLSERRRVGEFVSRTAAERHRIGELEVLDVVAVDARERRKALTIVSAMVHQPVLRLLVRIHQPVRCNLRSYCRPCQHAACEKRSLEGNVTSCHECLPSSMRTASWRCAWAAVYTIQNGMSAGGKIRSRVFARTHRIPAARLTRSRTARIPAPRQVGSPSRQ